MSELISSEFGWDISEFGLIQSSAFSDAFSNLFVMRVKWCSDVSKLILCRTCKSCTNICTINLYISLYKGLLTFNQFNAVIMNSSPLN